VVSSAGSSTFSTAVNTRWADDRDHLATRERQVDAGHLQAARGVSLLDPACLDDPWRAMGPM